MPKSKPASASHGDGDLFLHPDSDPLLLHERLFWQNGGSFLAGVDEAGRGCCAGPVVAAAVVFSDKSRIPAGVFDSKQLSEAAREDLRRRIIETPGVFFSVAEVPPDVIDRINILQATWRAMAQAVRDVIPPAEFALVDGNPVKGLPLPSQNLVKGDSLSASIAAASILAKTHRDHLMIAAAEQFPQYAFEIHKGYCTALHTERLRKFGPCPLHRRTFEPVRSLIAPMIQDDLFQ